MNNSSQIPSDFTPAFRQELIACYVCKYIFGLTGGITNVFLIAVVCLQSTTASVGVKWLVAQYSFAYFLISLIMYPVRDTMIMGTQFKFHVPLAEYCPHFATANTVCWALANWTEVCLAFNRVVAICFPHQYGAMKTKKATVGFLLFAWAMAFLAAIPATYAWPGRIVSKAALAQCSILQAGPASQFVTSWETFVSYCLTGLMSAVILGKAFMLSRRKTGVGDTAAITSAARGQQSKIGRRRTMLAFMLVASFTWNCACNLPFLVITMGLSSMFAKYPSLSLWVRMLRSVQVSLSPIVFFAFNEEYRWTGRRLLLTCCGLHAKRGQNGMKEPWSMQATRQTNKTLSITGTEKD